MHKQSSRATSDTESSRVNRRGTNGRQIGRHIHRQTNGTGFVEIWINMRIFH